MPHMSSLSKFLSDRFSLELNIFAHMHMLFQHTMESLGLAFNSSGKIKGIDISCQKMCSLKDERQERHNAMAVNKHFYWSFLWVSRDRKCVVQEQRRLPAASVSRSDSSYPSFLTCTNTTTVVWHLLTSTLSLKNNINAIINWYRLKGDINSRNFLK